MAPDLASYLTMRGQVAGTENRADEVSFACYRNVAKGRKLSEDRFFAYEVSMTTPEREQMTIGLLFYILLNAMKPRSR